jgi:hypothetical protein
MFGIIVIVAFGFILFVQQWDRRVASVENDSVNLSGINYTNEMANATNKTVHDLSELMSNLIFFILIFLAVAFISLLAIALKRH